MYRPRGERGATLLDAVVGTALMLVVFVGIVGAFRLTVIVVSNNKARAGAIALANERLEYIRSLPYQAVGTAGGIPAGGIAQTETVTLNDINYTRRTFISYEDDPADGLGSADVNGIITDYKAAKASVSWTSRSGVHTITLVTRVSPPGVETAVPGGTLAFTVVDASLAPVSNAQIRIVNPSVVPAVDMTTYTDADGTARILGTPPASGYQITVTKPGYSTSQTYGASATNTSPIPAHLGVALNQTTAATFAIDLLSSKTIEAYIPVTRATSTETFASAANIASSTNIVIADGVARLAQIDDSYPASGTLISTAVSTSSLAQWHAFSFADAEPSGTNVRYRIYDAAANVLIPDAQIPGNSAGLTASPVDLGNVSTSTYPALAVHITLTTSDPSAASSVDSWSIANDSGPIPLPNLSFSMTGAKTIGTNPQGGLIYKYDALLSSGPTGAVTVNELEWDSYTVVVPASTGYDIASICHAQPETLPPDTAQTTRIYVAPHTANSLLVDVRSAGGGPLAGASVRLYRGAYDASVQTDGCGQAFFSGLVVGTAGGGNPYSIDVNAPGHQAYVSNSVDVSGTSRSSILLNAN